MFSVGTAEILIVGALALVLFGPNRMPEMLRTFGKATREMRKAMSNVQAELEEAARADDEPKPPTKRP